MVPARLNGFARVNPLMIAPRADAEVRGELFFLQAADYAVTMRDCDILEGIPAGRTRGTIYSRVRVNVETSDETLTAWAYVQSGDETA